MTSPAPRVSAAVLLVVMLLSMSACDGSNPIGPSRPPPPAPVTPPGLGTTLSGQVFDLTPQGRVPAPPGIGLVVNVVSGNCPGIPCSATMHQRNTATGPDGRYIFSDLPPGSAALFAYGTHRQACGVFTPILASVELDLEVTSKTDPQPSPAPRPLRLTGQVYEMTAAGRVGVAGANVWFDWLNDAPFFGAQADGDGRYTVCGIPANWRLLTGAGQVGYVETYSYREFDADTTLDFELKRSR